MDFLAQQSSGNGGLIFGGAFFIVFVIIALLTSIFWLWMLVDAITGNRPSTEKLIWVLVILFLHVLGALLYFFIGRGNRAGV